MKPSYFSKLGSDPVGGHSYFGWRTYHDIADVFSGRDQLVAADDRVYIGGDQNATQVYCVCRCTFDDTVLRLAFAVWVVVRLSQFLFSALM